MSNSTLINMTKLSPNHSGKRTHAIDRITPHYVAGSLITANLASCFQTTEKKSCNYGIGSDKKIVLVVDEGNRAWTSSSSANDNRAVTIECANNPDSSLCDGVYDLLIELCTDICKRNGKTKLLWIADKTKALAYVPKADEMLLTVHQWFANTPCPGNWMMAHMADLAAKVTAKLAPVKVPEADHIYRVKPSWLSSEQKGAYKVLENAKATADKYPGYTVYDEKGNAVYTSERDWLQNGDDGWKVKEMQITLIACRYNCGTAGADGDFGKNTEKAVKEFQTENGLTASGIYDKATREKLAEFYRVVQLYYRKVPV